MSGSQRTLLTSQGRFADGILLRVHGSGVLRLPAHAGHCRLPRLPHLCQVCPNFSVKNHYVRPSTVASTEQALHPLPTNPFLALHVRGLGCHPLLNSRHGRWTMCDQFNQLLMRALPLLLRSSFDRQEGQLGVSPPFCVFYAPTTVHLYVK